MSLLKLLILSFLLDLVRITDTVREDCGYKRTCSYAELLIVSPTSYTPLQIDMQEHLKIVYRELVVHSSNCRYAARQESNRLNIKNEIAAIAVNVPQRRSRSADCLRPDNSIRTIPLGNES